MQYTIYLTLAPAAFIILVYVLGQILLRWQRRDAKLLFIFMAIALGYLTTQYLEVVTADLAVSSFWARFSFVFRAFLPAAWLAFVLQYTRQSTLVSFSRYWLLLLIPIVTAVFAVAEGGNRLLIANIALVEDGGHAMLDFAYGPWFWFHFCYTYILMAYGSVLLLKNQFFQNPVYRSQGRWMLFGTGLPLAVNLIGHSGLIPGFTRDFTPIAFSIGAAAMGVGIINHRLLSLVPIARERLVERMPDGYLVLDDLKRIVDCNASARLFFGIYHDCVGEEASVLGLPALALERNDEPFLHMAGPQDNPRFLNILRTPLFNDRGRPDGMLLILQDVSETARLLREKNELIASLQAARNEIRTLQGILPICSACKKIRDDDGYWHQVENYIGEQTDVRFSHGLCPDCRNRLYPDI